MARHDGETFEGAILDVDGEEYYDCVFKECTFKYGGGRTPVIVHCRLDAVRWRFHGAAEDTVNTLANIHSLGGWHRKKVESVIALIRGGFSDDAPHLYPKH